jgi:hypothetical protein
MSAVKSYDTFSVGKVDAVEIVADPERQAKITNMTGGKLFYKNAADVDTGDTELANGKSVTTEETLFVISETQTKVLVEHLEGLTVQDLTVTDAINSIGGVSLPVEVKNGAELADVIEALEEVGLIEEAAE